MVNIPRDIEHQLRYCSEKLYPEEACGVVLGTSHNGIMAIKEILELHNSSPVHRDERFLITPQQYQYAQGISRGKKLEILGYFLSHPNQKAEPSAYDLEHALPESLYLIIAVIGGSSAGMTGWVLSNNGRRFEQTPVQITA